MQYHMADIKWTRDNKNKIKYLYAVDVNRGMRNNLI